MGHYVVGVDVNEIEGVRERTDAFFQADLNEGIPSGVGDGFDIVLAADVLEHVVNPGNLISQVQGRTGTHRNRPRTACRTSRTGIQGSGPP